jgi:hypothetical protein
MAEPEPIERIAVRIAWVGVDDVPIAFVNQVIGQIDDRGEVIITFGQATPPVLIGTPEEQQQEAAAVPFVPVRPVARLSMSRTRLQELVGVLNQTLENQSKYYQQDQGDPT